MSARLSLLRVCEWIENSSVGTAIRESIWLFPIIETSHVLALAISVGTLMVFDLRLMGRVMTTTPLAEIGRELRPWFIVGFGLMFVTGGLLFWSEATRCYASGAFWIKMGLIILAGVNALTFERITSRRLVLEHQIGTPPRAAVVAGCLSLALWAAVIGTGRWMAYNLT